MFLLLWIESNLSIALYKYVCRKATALRYEHGLRITVFRISLLNTIHVQLTWIYARALPIGLFVDSDNEIHRKKAGNRRTVSCHYLDTIVHLDRKALSSRERMLQVPVISAA